MHRFLKRHLSVTLLCDQSWCEMKTVYSLLKPNVKRNEMKRAEVQMGRDIHLSRGKCYYGFTYLIVRHHVFNNLCLLSSELEIQNVVPVDIWTREEAKAIKLLNMLHMTQILQAGELMEL